MPVANKAGDHRRIRSGEAAPSGDTPPLTRPLTSSPRLSSAGTPPRHNSPVSPAAINPKKRRHDGGLVNAGGVGGGGANRGGGGGALNVPSPGSAAAACQAAAAAAAWTNSLCGGAGAPQISIPDSRLHAAVSRPGSRFSSVRQEKKDGHHEKENCFLRSRKFLKRLQHIIAVLFLLGFVRSTCLLNCIRNVLQHCAKHMPAEAQVLRPKL